MFATSSSLLSPSCTPIHQPSNYLSIDFSWYSGEIMVKTYFPKIWKYWLLVNACLRHSENSLWNLYKYLLSVTCGWDRCENRHLFNRDVQEGMWAFFCFGNPISRRIICWFCNQSRLECTFEMYALSTHLNTPGRCLAMYVTPPTHPLLPPRSTTPVQPPRRHRRHRRHPVT